MNLLSSFVKSFVKEEIDKALVLSNQRKEKFQKLFTKTDTPRVNKDSLSESRLHLMFKLISEQPFGLPTAPPSPTGPGTPPVDPMAMPGTDPAGTPPAPEGDPGALPGEDPEAPKGDEGDPVVNILDALKKTMETTTDVSELVKQAKGEIQTKFEKPTHALGLIQALADTHNPILRSVAARLLLFIKEVL